MTKARIAPIDPPYPTEILAEFDKIMRDDVDFRPPRSSFRCQANEAESNQETGNAQVGIREGDRSCEDDPMTRLLKGTCLCGSVEYAVEDAFLYALNCHCSRCRRTTGSAFKPLAGIERGKFQVTVGSNGLLVYGNALHHDAHCNQCGSLLYSVVREGEYIHVPLGSLVDDPSIRPSAHIFVGSKAPWFTITDALPQHHEFG